MTARTALRSFLRGCWFVLVLAAACVAMGFLAHVAVTLGRCGAGLGCYW